MNTKDGSNIPSWPGLGVKTVDPIVKSTSTQIARTGVKLRARVRGADQITVSESGFVLENIHCIGSFASCRKRAFARIDNPIIVRPKLTDMIGTATAIDVTLSMPNVARSLVSATGLLPFDPYWCMTAATGGRPPSAFGGEGAEEDEAFHVTAVPVRGMDVIDRRHSPSSRTQHRGCPADHEAYG